jgi:hypothetical protein
MRRRPPKPPDRDTVPRYVKPKPRTLAALSRDRIAEKDNDAFLSELEGASDRTTCIVAASFIERILESVILVVRCKHKIPY